MTSYGGYVIQRPHSLGALTSVYEVAASDGGSGRFALKVFHPPKSGKLRRFLAIERWLLAAERQQQAAKSGVAVDVVAMGPCDEGAFVVMPWMETSLESLAATLASRGNNLRALTKILLTAIEGWASSYGGPHGNLKLGNIFIQGNGLLATRTVRLSDTSIAPGAKDAALRRHDLAQIGEVLVKVVRRRAAGGWPIEVAPEWQALGRPGEAWREFCNFLLNPEIAPEELTIEQVWDALKKIPYDPRSGRNWALGAAAVVVLSVGGVLGFARFASLSSLPQGMLQLAEWVGNPHMTRAEISPEWAQLCRSWNAWGNDIARNSERWESVDPLWVANDPLRKALAQFRAIKEIDPRIVVPEAAGNSMGALADSPPEKVRIQLLRELVNRRVQNALQQLDLVAAQLAAWSGWIQISDTGTQLDARRRPRVAAEVRKLLPQIPSEETHADLITSAQVKALNRLSQDQYGALVLLQRWRAYEAAAAELAATGDRVQKALPQLALTTAADDSSLGDFAEALTAPLEELKRRYQQFLAPEVSRERFLKESPLLKETGEVRATDIPKWEEQLVLFSTLPAAEDPRLADDWDATLRTLSTKSADLEDEAPVGEAGVRSISIGEFNKELSSVKSTLGALRGRQVLRVDRLDLSHAVDGLRAVLAELQKRVDGTIALLRPELWLDGIGSRVWKFEAVRKQWAAWKQRDLTGLTAQSLQKDRARFRQLRQVERGVREWLEAFEGPQGMGSLVVPTFKKPASDSVVELQAIEKVRREQVVADVLTVAPWTDARPTTTWDDAAAQSEVEAPMASHRRWLAALPAFADELDRLGQLLAGGYSWSEGVGEALAALSARAGLDELQGAVAKRIGEARQLELLVRSVDRAQLIAAARSDGLSLRLTGWRRLVELPDWPSSLSELNIEGELGVGLRKAIGEGRLDSQRRTSLLDELTRVLRSGWLRAAWKTVGNETDLAAAFACMEQFGVAEKDLDEPMSFNFRLMQFKRSDWNENDLAVMRERRDAFVSSVKALRGVVEMPTVAPMLSALEALTLRDDPNQPKANTPKRAGWREEFSEGGQALIASWTGGGKSVQLVFQLVQPTDNNAPFYLARRAISAGEFIDLVNTRPEGKAVIDAMPSWVRRLPGSTEPWTALMAWVPRADGTGFELSASWIYHAAPDVAGSVLDEIGAERPSAESPLQRVPPEAARIFTEQILGARLPKLSEWQALMQIGVDVKKGNFRDQRFTKLWNFLQQYRVAEQTIAWRPNQGIYLPLQDPKPGTGTRRVLLSDDGQVKADAASSGIWPSRVDRGPETNGFIHLLGNVWVYIYDEAQKQYYVAGGSVLSPPTLDPTVPQKVEGVAVIGAARGRTVVDGYSDVGIRPAFDAPLSLRERFEMLRLARTQQFLSQ